MYRSSRSIWAPTEEEKPRFSKFLPTCFILPEPSLPGSESPWLERTPSPPPESADHDMPENPPLDIETLLKELRDWHLANDLETASLNKELNIIQRPTRSLFRENLMRKARECLRDYFARKYQLRSSRASRGSQLDAASATRTRDSNISQHESQQSIDKIPFENSKT